MNTQYAKCPLSSFSRPHRSHETLLVLACINLLYVLCRLDLASWENENKNPRSSDRPRQRLSPYKQNEDSQHPLGARQSILQIFRLEIGFFPDMGERRTPIVSELQITTPDADCSCYSASARLEKSIKAIRFRAGMDWDSNSG